MDGGALEWWKEHKTIIKQIIDSFPASDTGYKEKDEEAA
jgi:hypothetical protein